LIDKLNNKEGETATFEVNKYADMSQEEFTKKYLTNYDLEDSNE